MTKDEIIDQLTVRLIKKGKDTLSFAEIAQSVQALTSAQKQAIVEAIKDRDPKKTGELLVRAVHLDIKNWAKGEVTTMLTDDSLSLVEIERLL